ncbi:MAG: aminopeptidase P family protein, partial [Acidobacteria bacterium]|nr:aminopeptidase P family protein [Acidobacteriota bacterium]
MDSAAATGERAPLFGGFTREEFHTRIRRTRQALERAGIDALLTFANKVLPGHTRYLSGYETRHGIHDWTVLILDLDPVRPPRLVTNVSWEPLAQMSWVEDARLSGLDQLGGAIADWLRPGVKLLGVAGFPFLPAPVYRALAERLPQARIEDASGLLFEVRRVKSPAEVAALRKASEISDAGGSAFLAGAREGRSEREILVEVESALKLNGSDEVSFTTQVGSGLSTVTICPYATDRRLEKGDLVQLDCGATYLGYRGDLSRVTVVGEPSARQRLLLEVTAEMYEVMLAAIRPGAAASEVARIGIDIARSRGLEHGLYQSPTHPIYFMGHGIGAGYHEPPELNLLTDAPLEENMVMVLEPILSEKGVGGVKL